MPINRFCISPLGFADTRAATALTPVSSRRLRVTRIITWAIFTILVRTRLYKYLRLEFPLELTLYLLYFSLASFLLHTMAIDPCSCSFLTPRRLLLLVAFWTGYDFGDLYTGAFTITLRKSEKTANGDPNWVFLDRGGLSSPSRNPPRPRPRETGHGNTVHTKQL